MKYLSNERLLYSEAALKQILRCIVLLLNVMLVGLPGGIPHTHMHAHTHTRSSLTPPEMDQIKSSAHITAAVCLVFAANFTAIYW